MKLPLAPRSDIYQPDSQHTYGSNPDYLLSQKFYASLVGTVALFLPIFMLFWPWRDACFRDSISHYYYAQFQGAVLVAALAFIGTFLFAYRGQHPRENLYAFFAGLGALGVALFPTTGTGCEDALSVSSHLFAELTRAEAGAPLVLTSSDVPKMFELFRFTDWFHYASAAVLFAFLGWYCFRVFPRTIPSLHYASTGDGVTMPKAVRMKPQKVARNAIYYVSGGVIVVSAGAMAVRGIFAATGNDPAWWNAGNWTFWFEAFALWAFGVSWIVRGRGFGKLKFLEDKG